MQIGTIGSGAYVINSWVVTEEGPAIRYISNRDTVSYALVSFIENNVESPFKFPVRPVALISIGSYNSIQKTGTDSDGHNIYTFYEK